MSSSSTCTRSRPTRRPEGNPWPQWPLILRTYPAHDEGGSREFGLMVTAFEGDAGNVRRVRAIARRRRAARTACAPSSRSPTVTSRLDADLVLIAIGYDGPRPLAAARRAVRRLDRCRQRRRRRDVRLHRRRACSPRATRSAVRRSSCGRSPTAAPPRGVATRTSWGLSGYPDRPMVQRSFLGDATHDRLRPSRWRR